MVDTIEIVKQSYLGYFTYLKNEILYPSWHNYFYWLVGLSLAVWMVELIFPWRKEQASFRRDFWLDGFYMFFNFFLFSLIGYNAMSTVAVAFFNDILLSVNIRNLVAINVQSWPPLFQFLLMFVVADFIQWNIHRLLHRSPFLWEFHKVHHSVQEMGFAAHLRFHWMETIIYKSLQYIPLAMIGFGIQDFIIIHLIAVGIGHLNHANIKLTYGPFRYLLNNPVMHLWHHAKELPKGRYGVNFGLSLSVWDYIFRTAYLPVENANQPLGFEMVEAYPQSFFAQLIKPFKPQGTANSLTKIRDRETG